MTTFGSRLAHALDLRSMSQNELARVSGVSQGSISRYTRSDRKDLALALALARALGISAAWLAWEAGPMINETGSWSDPTAALLNFAERLRGARRDAGFHTPKTAAKAASIEPTRWASFEAAKGWPDASEMLQIMQALGISLDYLIAGVGLPKPGSPVRAPEAGFLHDKSTSKDG